jgi:hypothetical protein
MLIRLGGLAAVVGGALYFSGLILYLPAKHPIDLHGIGNIFGGLWLVLFIVLLVGAMAATLAIAALYARRRDFYGAFGMVVALVAFVGVALIFAGEIRLSGRVEIYGEAELCGLLLGSLGVLALGLVVTIAVRELPWWSGVALVVWGPAVFWLLLDGGRFGWTSQATLLGMPWIMVGFAVFRAAGRRTEPPSKVR